MRITKLEKSMLFLFIFMLFLMPLAFAQDEFKASDFIKAENTRGLISNNINPLQMLSITLQGSKFKPGDKVFFTAQERARQDCNKDGQKGMLTVRFVQPDNSYYIFSSPGGAKANWVILEEKPIAMGGSLSKSYSFIVPVDAQIGSWSIISELFCGNYDSNNNLISATQNYDFPSFVDFDVNKDLLQQCVIGDYSDTYCIGNPGSGQEQWVRDRFTGRATGNNICEIQTITIDACQPDEHCTNQIGCIKSGSSLNARGVAIAPGSNPGQPRINLFMVGLFIFLGLAIISAGFYFFGVITGSALTILIIIISLISVANGSSYFTSGLGGKNNVVCQVNVKNNILQASKIDSFNCVKQDSCLLSVSNPLGIFSDTGTVVINLGGDTAKQQVTVREEGSQLVSLNVCTKNTEGILELRDENNNVIDSRSIKV